MDDTSKYLIHAAITADGVVERSDVVGAIFGQTEGLLGDDLDLRDLQQSSKVGRIDVEISSEEGQSDGRITIATSLDKVETAILAASLETITRVGPCRARVEVTDIEDVREAKRREVVERAKELLAESFDDSIMTSAEILEEVRESVRVEDITEYHGFPAGPRVSDSDAIIVVEGRADVLTLLRYGIKNAVAVEGTNVPDSVAELTQERTVTAFLDGDRGGELILRELEQVGDVDFVAFAPEGRSVEDLARHEVMRALREKVPFESVSEEESARAAVTPGGATTDESSGDAPTEAADSDSAGAPAATEPSASEDTPGDERTDESDDDRVAEQSTGEQSVDDGYIGEDADGPEAAETDGAGAVQRRPPVEHGEARAETADASEEGDAASLREPDDATGTETTQASNATETVGETSAATAATIRDHVREILDAESGRARLLDDEMGVLTEVDADEAFDAIRDAETVPYTVVLDGQLSQRILDIAAQRGVEHAVVRETGEFVKKPVDVRIRTAAQVVPER
jgi:DNA primase